MTKKIDSDIGLAIIGCGTIGRIRAKFARDYPGIGWLGLCDIDESLGRELAEEVGADFFTTDFEELIVRPEVQATMIITDENRHTEPTLKAVDQGHKLFIEKPLATEARESKQILDAITADGLDACIETPEKHFNDGMHRGKCKFRRIDFVWKKPNQFLNFIGIKFFSSLK